MEQYLTVSQLTKYISKKFQVDPYLDKVFLKGEISNYNPRRSGVQYFKLKDENSILSAVLFPSDARNIKFEPENGMSVLITGRVSVYEAGGYYQIVVHSMQPDGLGALYLAYEQTKEALSKEGLFAMDLKKPIPKYPKRIAVLTSPSGAVIQDILTTVKRRYPIAEVVLFPTVVQGNQSADSIVGNIKHAEAMGNFDTMIIGRGGGSFEDLFSFNEEKVVRAIAEAKTPVISSVGHETDTTLTDLVADLRAPTPTAAAELAVPVLTEEILRIEEYNQRMFRAFQARIQHLSEKLYRVTNSVIFRQPERLYDGYLQNVDQLENRLMNRMESIVKTNQQQADLLTQRLKGYPIRPYVKEQSTRIDYLTKKLQQSLSNQLQQKNFKVTQAIQALEHLSPLKILARGYAVIEKDDTVIRSVEEVSKGDRLNLILNDGTITTEVILLEKKEND